MVYICSLSLLLLVLLPTVGHADLVKIDLFLPDDGFITLDTDTDLEWLSPDATRNLTIQQIINDVPGYAALGFRRANLTEVCSILGRVQGPDCRVTNFGSDAVDRSSTLDLMSTLALNQTVGAPLIGVFLQGRAVLSVNSTEGFRIVETFFPPEPSADRGHWLVRDALTVPEPSPTRLCVLLVLLISAARRMKMPS